MLRHERQARSLLEGILAGGCSALLDGEAAARLDRLRASDASLRWIGVNGSRVDAVLASPSGNEWRIVFGADGDGDGPVEWLFVLEQLPPMVPVPGGVAVVVHGASGAGKSTLLDALAAGEDPWVVFDEPTFGSVREAYLVWPETAEPLHRGFLAGMAAVAAAGNRVGASAAGHQQDWFRAAFEGVPTLYVGLRCPLPVLLEREHGRDGRWGGLAEESFRALGGWKYDLVLDTAEAAPAELAAHVNAELLARGR